MFWMFHTLTQRPVFWLYSCTRHGGSLKLAGPQRLRRLLTAPSPSARARCC
jgi:hypothetical protein